MPPVRLRTRERIVGANKVRRIRHQLGAQLGVYHGEVTIFNLLVSACDDTREPKNASSSSHLYISKYSNLNEVVVVPVYSIVKVLLQSVPAHGNLSHQIEASGPNRLVVICPQGTYTWKFSSCVILEEAGYRNIANAF